MKQSDVVRLARREAEDWIWNLDAKGLVTARDCTTNTLEAMARSMDVHGRNKIPTSHVGRYYTELAKHAVRLVAESA